MANRLPPYLHRKAGKDGYYFIRRVPLDLKEKVGKTFWRQLLAHDLMTARRKLPALIAETDELIELLRAGKSVDTRPSNQRPAELDRKLLQGQPAEEVYNDPRFFGTPEEAETVSELPPVQVLSAVPLHPEELLQIALERKPRIAQSTQQEWARHLRSFTEFLGHTNLHLVSEEDAQSFRAHLLTKLKVSTTTVRLGYLGGLFNSAFRRKRITSNPFLNIQDGLRSGEGGGDQAPQEFDVAHSDRVVDEVLPQLDRDLYWCLRWTGCRIAEIAGLKSKDINLEEGFINLVPYMDKVIDKDMPRPLKNKYSLRRVPIHPKLRPVLERLVAASERPFAEFYRPIDGRWRSHIVWSTKIGLKPHALRHNMITTLRSKGVSEYVIGRIAGHRVPGMTSQYGSISIDKLHEAIKLLE